MRTRRELTQAVVEAAKQSTTPSYHCGTYTATLVPENDVLALKDAIRALDACTEPDLAELDAAVAQAVEEWYDAKKKAHYGTQDLDAWRDDLSNVYRAESSRRAALKPRYEATDATRILDNQTGYLLTANCIAMLLNEKEAAK
jgi:hypothetical protein